MDTVEYEYLHQSINSESSSSCCVPSHTLQVWSVDRDHRPRPNNRENMDGFNTSPHCRFKRQQIWGRKYVSFNYLLKIWHTFVSFDVNAQTLRGRPDTHPHDTPYTVLSVCHTIFPPSKASRSLVSSIVTWVQRVRIWRSSLLWDQPSRVVLRPCPVPRTGRDVVGAGISVSSPAMFQQILEVNAEKMALLQAHDSRLSEPLHQLCQCL